MEIYRQFRTFDAIKFEFRIQRCIMDHITKFRRDRFKTSRGCCNNKTDHWYFKTIQHSLCDCGTNYSFGPCEYWFCRNTLSMGIDPTIRTLSLHNDCSKSTILEMRKVVMIDEVRCLYNKLRIIEPELTADCIRYITLSELIKISLNIVYQS